MREFDRPVALGGQRRDRRLDHEAIGLALEPLHFALGSDLGARTAEGDAADRRLALLETDEVGQGRGAAEFPIAYRREAPDLLEELRRLGDVGDA